jgi:ABC-type multidrug transport system ATPase subunit
MRASWTICLEGASKRYGADVLFENLDIELRPGEALRVLGPNGSGKTQLLLALCGLNPLDRGRLVLDDGAGPVALPEDPNRRDRYLRYVPDTPAALSSLAVAELAAVLARSISPLSLRSRRQAVARAYAAMRAFVEGFVGHQLSPDRPASQLSMGQQKRLAMAATVATIVPPRALLVDEPLAGLDHQGTAAVLAALAEIRLRGVALVVAEHRPAIKALGFDAELTMPYRRIRPGMPRPSVPAMAALPGRPTESETCAGAPLLMIRHASAGYPGASVHSPGLTLGAGNVAVIGGANGSGKTGFLKALVGQWPARFEGQLELAGLPLASLAGPLAAGKVRYMSQDRRSFPDLRAEDALRAASMNGDGEIPTEVLTVSKVVGPRRKVAHLSSGNRALLCLAQTLATRPRLALLDEPTANVDATNRQRMMDLIAYAREAWGTAFLVVEHDDLPAFGGMRYHIQRDADESVWLREAPT